MPAAIRPSGSTTTTSSPAAAPIAAADAEVLPVDAHRIASAPLTWDELPTSRLDCFTILTMPDRYAALGDLSDGIDGVVGELDALLELAERDEAEGLPDAPWPPQYEKQPGEAPRVQPSKRKKGAVAEPAPGKSSGASGRRRSTMPLIEIARAETEEEATSGRSSVPRIC